MKLSEVPIVTVVHPTRVPQFIAGTDTTRGQKLWISEDVEQRLYDFGPSANGHEEHVMFAVGEFACANHAEFTPGCEACIVAAWGPADNPQGPLVALRKSRGIEVEAA